jgi:carbamoyltransferase
VRGEPIVCSPADALRCFIKSNLDLLVLEDFIVEQGMVSEELREAVHLWYPEPAEAIPATRSSVYTFV